MKLENRRKFAPQHYKRVGLVLHVLGLLSAFSAAFAQELPFVVDGMSMCWQTSCAQSPRSVPAGAPLLLNVINRADQPAELRVPGWPGGYTLEAALDLPRATSFVPTSGLIERLNPIPYLNHFNQIENRHLSEKDLAYLDVGELNVKAFMVHIPSDLAGHSLSIRARCDKGGAPRYSTPLEQFQVVLPCSRSDSACMMAGEIFIALDMKDPGRAMAFADSMLALGLTNAGAWKWAMAAAQSISQWDKYIAYLDQLYRDYGVVSFEGLGGTRRLNRDGQRSSSDRQLYERERSNALEWKARQEQRLREMQDQQPLH